MGRSNLLDSFRRLDFLLQYLLFYFCFLVDLAANSLLNKLIRQSLVESSHRVEVLQKDPSSPLYSVKTFEELRLWVFLLIYCGEIPERMVQNKKSNNKNSQNHLHVLIFNIKMRCVHFACNWNIIQKGGLGYLSMQQIENILMVKYFNLAMLRGIAKLNTAMLLFSVP